MKVVNPLSKILIIIELTFGLMISTNCMSAQNTSPLCFTARNGKVVVRFSIRNITHTIQYSTNGTTWNNYTSNSNVTVNSNHSIYFRAAANQSVATAFGAGSLSNCSRFYFTSTNGGTIEASGNIMSLYGPDCPDLPLQQYAFYQMFYQCGLLTAAPELPATTLAENCYGSMFYYCTALTSAPALPASALARSCYYNMFYYCTSLTAAPALPATTLAPNCYNYMFIGCTSLAAAPALPADTLAESCYSDMFNGCTSLVVAPALPATTLADSCYNNMFYGCTSLAAAPALPATVLAKYCYYNMFHGCTSLTVAPALPATTMAPYCYGRMFTDCTSLTAAPALPADTLARWCYNNMFSGCSSLARTPDLPATALAPNCYNYMFSSCTSLIAPPVLPATTLADSCYFRMFRGCSSMVVNIAPPGINWIITAPSSAPAALTQMFSGTGGTMNGTPRVQTTYYIASGILTATALANDSAMGSVSGSGLYLIGDTVTMSATPYGNYSFVCWSNGATTPVISFIIDRDTTLTAIFTLLPTCLFEDSAAICQGGSYLWRGRNLTAAGVYYDSLHTSVVCDSVYKLTLTVNPKYLFSDNASICPGESYLWHGRNLTTAGVYYDSLQTAAGCDSVHKLTLTVNPTYFIEENHSICQGDNYPWHGRTLTTTGVYYDSLQTTAGCDSVHKFTLTVNPTYFIQESHAICPGESYLWHGRNLTIAGVYYDSLQTAAGCDSVYKLTLTVNPTYFIEENHSICQGDNYPWHGRNLTIAGVYYDSLQTRAGCDSIHKLTLTVNPTYSIEESHVICQGDRYTWHGRTLTTTGVYFDSLQTAAGCDSVYELTLTVNPSYLIQQAQTINQGDSLTWHGRTLTTTGIYYDSLLTTAGCDSIYKLTLTVNHSYLFEDSVTICRGDVYPWRGQNITAAGVYYDSLITSAGFDSVYTLTVSIKQHDVTLNVNDPAMGSVTGDGTYECGEKVQITATAADSCHSFDRWSDGDASNPRTFVIKSDTSFTAIFRKNTYMVTVSPSNVRGGTAYCITDSGKDSVITVECGETVEIHAESTDNYHFAGWSDGGTDSIRTITVTSDTDIVAIFNANCGDMTHWPVEFKFNNLLIVNLNALNAEGYYPLPSRVSWYMAVGNVDAVEGATFPVDDQFVCTGYYLSLIANGLNGGRYYAVIDAVDIGTPCVGYMKSEIIEYIPGSQQIRIEVAPTEVRNGEQVTVSGLIPDETSIVRVCDYTGRVMQTIATSGTEQCQIQAAATAGVYMINVTSETVNETFRFVVTK